MNHKDDEKEDYKEDDEETGMRIERIRLDHFRNIKELDLALHPGTNLFFGDNAQGKTNILESMFLCGTTKSHRGGKDRDMIMFGREEAHIRIDFIRKEVPYRVDMHLKKNKPKGIAINCVPVKRAGELVGLCSFVFFSPEDLGLIKDGPAVRRRFIDMELSQLSGLYLSDLTGYNRVLAQRNRLLKDISFRPDLIETLDIWDEKLCEYGCRIIAARKSFIEKLGEKIVSIHRSLTGGKEEMELFYEANAGPDEMKDRVRSGRERDIHLGSTMTGPHRDDLCLLSNGIDLRVFGSQGQQRTGALSLKLAEIGLVRDITEDTPILMLDDVLSELDQGRQRYLLDSIRDVQTMMTSTGRDFFSEFNFQIDRFYQVSAGTVVTG